MHWKTRSRITTWLLGIVTIGFLLFQWAPMFTMFTLSFAGENGGTTFPMNGVSFHWYRKLWDADLFDDFKPPMLRSFLLALASEAVDRAAFYAALEPSTPASRMEAEARAALAG